MSFETEAVDLPSVPKNPLRRAVFMGLSRFANSAAGRDGPSVRGMAKLIARLIARKVTPVAQAQGPAPVRMLAFSHERFKEDFATLGKSGRFDIVAAPTSVLQAVNALFPIRPGGAKDRSYSYYNDATGTRLEARQKLERLAAATLQELRAILKIDCIVSPTAHYEYQVPWAAAAEKIRLPFIALHKEFTVVPLDQLMARKVRIRARGLRFPGTKILVTNRRALELLAESGVIDRSRMVVTGLPRMDRLFRSAETATTPSTPTRNQVTLFSFGHYSGGMKAPEATFGTLFNANREFGFVELFDAVHGAMGELALRHPDTTFSIKPKFPAPWWIEQIHRAVQAATDRPFASIANLRIVDESAVKLMQESVAVIGFNSTVLLESTILNRPTIVPLFAEAAGRHSDSIYLREEMDIFYEAKSRQDLVESIERVLAGGELRPPASPERVRQVMEEYLGHADSRSSERVVEAIVETVGEMRSGLASK